MSDLVERPSSIGEAWRKLIQQQAEIERLEGDLQVTRLQRDARMVSEFVVDDAVKAEIERLRKDRLCRCADEVRCEMKAEIERLTKGWEGLEYEASAQIASLAAAVNTMHKEAIEQEAEIERLEAKLTQDPKDARCQLYKATQRWQQEAERCNAVVDAAKGVIEYGEVAFMGVNIPFKSFRKLKEALPELEER